MGYSIGTVTDPGGNPALYQLLGVIKTLAEANGWTTLRYINSGTDQELILQGNGLSGTEQIFIGFKTYLDVAADYYNIAASTMTGYLSANTFETQPGIQMCGTPAHNNAITYFITANAQRIVGCLKVGTPVYSHFYVGKMLPYARPGEYPAPLIAAGSFNGKAATRFSATTYDMPYYGWHNGGNARALYLRSQAGAWITPDAWPWSDTGNSSYAVLAGGGGSVSLRSLVQTGTGFHLLPVILHDATPNVYGELDGVSMISGMNNGVENVMQIGGTAVDQSGLTVLQAVDAIRSNSGRAFVVVQDGSRTGWNNFAALEMS